MLKMTSMAVLTGLLAVFFGIPVSPAFGDQIAIVYSTDVRGVVTPCQH